MKKLELKHLAPYLPYELRALDNLDKGIIITLSKETGVLQFDDKRLGIDIVFYDELRPILRPLTDLTKEIEINGEKFIPIQKICRLFAYSEQYSKEWSFGNDEDTYYTIATDSIMSRKFEYSFIDKEFTLSNPRDNLFGFTVKQLEALNKLFEWHFDVFGLIPDGLAISFNDIR